MHVLLLLFSYSCSVDNFLGVCTSGLESDLEVTDSIAGSVIRELLIHADEKCRLQFKDNLLWITNAGSNKLVVGSQARILYSDATVGVTISIRVEQ